MQIKTMSALSTLFKSKWNLLMARRLANQQQQLRRDSSDDDDTMVSRTKTRKHSDATFAGTFDSTVSIKDKLLHVIPFFRRTSSSNVSTLNENVAHTAIPSDDYCQEVDKKLRELYILALDELNFAEDSQGSIYYSGDRVHASEAVDNFVNACIELLRHSTATLAREALLQSSMAPKLIQLVDRINSLPEVDEC